MSGRCLRNWASAALLATLVVLLGVGCPMISPETPDIIGMEEAVALEALASAGLLPDVQRIHDDVEPEGIVVNQDPPAGTAVPRGSTVAVVVSRGPAYVPDVVGSRYDEAEVAILGTDLIVGEVTELFSATPAGFVLASMPEAATRISVGSAVNLTVSKGPDPMVGLINVPASPAPVQLEVDGLPRSQNADLSEGAWHWFRFEGVANTKYYVHVTGNAPVNAMVFIGRDVEGSQQQAADMLWTTDPLFPYFEHLWDWICNTCDSSIDFNVDVNSGFEKIAKSEKAILIPNFVAPETATYYVVAQAAKVITWSPDMTDSDYLMAGYYDVRTFSAQVTTSASIDDALDIQTFDPKGAAPFYQGSVKVNKHDWVKFEAQEDSNYMIEFLVPDLSRDYSVKATVFGPLGDVVCVAYACTDLGYCAPEPLYTPFADTYYIKIEVGDAPGGSGHYQGPDDLEFGQFPYILRVLEDDHGNDPVLATPIVTPGLNEEVVEEGYLSRLDVDWFEFKPERNSTYLVETRGRFEIDLGFYSSLVQGSWMYDGRNQLAVVQTGHATPPVLFGVEMPAKPNEPFWLQAGEYEVAVIGDDHVDNAIGNIDAAQNVPVPGSTSGVLWPFDTDMFAFDLAHNYMYLVESTSVDTQEVLVVNSARNGLIGLSSEEWPVGQIGEKNLSAYLNPKTLGVSADTTAYVVVSDDMDTDGGVFEVNYSVTVEKGANPIFTGVADDEAQVIPVGGSVSSSLWPNEDHVLMFTATKAGHWYQLSLTGADQLAAFVDDGKAQLTPVGLSQGQDENWYLQLDEVGEAGTDVYLRVSKSDSEATTYTVALREDDHGNTGATATVLTTSALGVLWSDVDSDAFQFEAQAGKLYKIRLTADGPVAGLGANLSSEDDVYEYERVFAAGLQTRTEVVSVQNAGDNSEVAYTITLVEDDHGNTDATATALTSGAYTDGEVWLNDIDVFTFKAEANTSYEVRVEVVGEDEQVVVDVVVPGGVISDDWQLENERYVFQAAGDGDVFITVQPTTATTSYRVRFRELTPIPDAV